MKAAFSKAVFFCTVRFAAVALESPPTQPRSRPLNAPHTSAPAEPVVPAEAKRDAAGDAAVAKILAEILASLDDDKAEDVLAIDLAGKTSIADHMVVASGRSARHVSSIAEKLLDRLKELRGARPKSEGVDAGDWALIDVGDVIVHVFRPEVRAFYQLEKMWAPEWVAERAAVSNSASSAAAASEPTAGSDG